MLLGDSVFFVEENYFRLMNRCFLGVIEAETHYAQAIARLSQMGGGAIYLYRACIPNPVNDVGFESFTVRQVAH